MSDLPTGWENMEPGALARELVDLQETQREMGIVLNATNDDDPFSREYVDSSEYEFLRGLRRVPDFLLRHLRGRNRRRLVVAAGRLSTIAEEIAHEILERGERGPLAPSERDHSREAWYRDGMHHHYPSTPHGWLIERQLLEDTVQCLEDYAVSIQHVV